MHIPLLTPITLLLLLLPPLTPAIPQPQPPATTNTNDPEPPITTSTPFITAPTSPDDTITEPPVAPSSHTTRSKRPHWEPIPVFSKPCTCDLATVGYPCWATDGLQRCHFEENFSYGCYMQAAGGCPTPTRDCSSLFSPTPRPGPHPCEGGPGPGPEMPGITGLGDWVV